jgi:hypothetical protein
LIFWFALSTRAFDRPNLREAAMSSRRARTVRESLTTAGILERHAHASHRSSSTNAARAVGWAKT